MSLKTQLKIEVLPPYNGGKKCQEKSLNYKVSFSDHLLHLFFADSFPIFYHGSQSPAITVVKPVNWFALHSIWWGTLVVNGLTIFLNQIVYWNNFGSNLYVTYLFFKSDRVVDFKKLAYLLEVIKSCLIEGWGD